MSRKVVRLAVFLGLVCFLGQSSLAQHFVKMSDEGILLPISDRLELS